MALIKTLRGKTPTIGKGTWLAETATIIGDVQMGDSCTIWYNAVLRGDVNNITLGHKVNVQDNVMIHCTYQKAGTRIGDNVSIGHNAIVHGCDIDNNVLIGMGAIVMDNAHVGEGVIVAAGAVVKENTLVPPYTLWAGVPARQVKELDKEKTSEQLLRLANNYVKYASWYQNDADKMKEEQVVLVNEQDEVQGLMGKQEAHEKGLLHRAISILLFNKNKEILIQQRADSKYHWAGIWSNAVCTHPRENETYAAAAKRRLFEELGIETELKPMFHFIYKAKDEESGLTEHELDHVFVGNYEGEIPFNTDEVKAVRWISKADLEKELAENPEQFSFWFKEILKAFKQRGLL